MTLGADCQPCRRCRRCRRCRGRLASSSLARPRQRTHETTKLQSDGRCRHVSSGVRKRLLVGGKPHDCSQPVPVSSRGIPHRRHDQQDCEGRQDKSCDRECDCPHPSTRTECCGSHRDPAATRSPCNRATEHRHRLWLPPTRPLPWPRMGMPARCRPRLGANGPGEEAADATSIPLTPSGRTPSGAPRRRPSQ